MQRLLIVLMLVLGASQALAQEADETPRRLNTMSLREREHEVEQQSFQGASGFWTSPYKSKQPYRYRLMLIGCALVLGTGLVIARLIKKANAERVARLGNLDAAPRPGARRPSASENGNRDAGSDGLPVAVVVDRTKKDRDPSKTESSEPPPKSESNDDHRNDLRA